MPDQEFFGISLGILTPSALCGLFVLFILTGKLVPKSTVDSRIQDKDDVIAELRTTSTTREKHVNTLLEQNSLLLRGAETTLHVVESLPRVDGG
ncbi:holin [Rhodococcus phage ReqiDocB7]|uniref:holin n=1 Tax=Rhodococcus phage ReqiDocB7 TaxID=691966 RepID=UPI0001CDD75E|nr:holin [Rhodococcus phage ReqiDocB7]ADD80814.1 holin [Rhodococcus phage ReqiDocB7]